MALHPQSEVRVLGRLLGDGGEAKYGAWLIAIACLVLNLSAGRCLDDLLVGPCSAHGGRDGKFWL
jgi:hypothetical protein